MNNSNDIYTLKEWLALHNIKSSEGVEKLKSIFSNMDREMKELHSNNYYIKSFNVNNILISGDYIKYTDIGILDSDYRRDYINKNIYYLACLQLGIYSDCLEYINPENKKYLKEEFDSFSIFLPDDIMLYYKGVFVNELNIYLDDFLRAKIRREMGNNSSLLDDGNNRRQGMHYSKSTMVGRIMSDDSNIAAFITIWLFPIIILLLSIIIPLMIILSR